MPGAAMRNLFPLARRNLLKGAGFGIGAGLLTRVSTAAQAHADDVWSAEYWANKGNVKLNLWRKRIGALAVFLGLWIGLPSLLLLPLVALGIGAAGFLAARVDVTKNTHLSARAGFYQYAIADDGVIEGIESTRHRFAIGVQWHPEVLAPKRQAHRRIIEAFVAACRKR